METTSSPYGYCHATIASPSGGNVLRSNSERAFVVTQLQDLLSPRFILGDIPAYRQLASCIDLLAFSISRDAIHFVFFTIDATLASDFTHRIAARLGQYQYDYTKNQARALPEFRISIKNLAGPHEALRQSVAIHLLHRDWENDRYSSIGFYLHDRRGDWMRIWRLSNLYENNAAIYREFFEPSPTLLVARLAS